MKLTIPITGTVKVEATALGAGLLEGDPNDPIRPIPLDLGSNVSWTMVNLNIEEGTMVLEVLPAEQIAEPTGEVIPETQEPIMRFRATTPQEKAGFLQYAQQLVEGKTTDELYALTTSAKLKRPFKEGV